MAEDREQGSGGSVLGQGFADAAPRQFEMQSGAPQQGEPKVGHDRAEDGHRQHQFTDAAAAADTGGEQPHQGRIAEEPAPVEHRPAVHPVRRHGIGSEGHLRQVDQVGDEAAEEVLHQPEARAQKQQARRHGQGEPHIELRQPLDAFLNAADGGGREDGGQQHHHQGLQAGTVAEPGQLPCGIAELQREETQGANRAGDCGHHRQPIRQVTERTIHPAARNDVHQQCAGTQGFTASLQDREGDRGGGGHQGPGEEAPVQKTHRQGGIHRCGCAALDPRKHR